MIYTDVPEGAIIGIYDHRPTLKKPPPRMTIIKNNGLFEITRNYDRSPMKGKDVVRHNDFHELLRMYLHYEYKVYMFWTYKQLRRWMERKSN